MLFRFATDFPIRLAIAFCVVLFLGNSILLAHYDGSQADAAGFIITVPGRNDIPLAIPVPQTPQGDPKDHSVPLWDSLRTDLALSGYFQIIDPAAYIEKGKGVEPGDFNFGDWKTIDTAVLVKTRVFTDTPDCSKTADSICADVFIYYVMSGELLASKRFRTHAQAPRQLAHKIADTVLVTITGNYGFFNGKIAAVGNQGGNKEIYVMDIDGHGQKSVTQNGSINLSPAWSPKKKKIAWTSYKRGNPDLFTKELATGKTRTISNRRGINASPAFSPDGRTIAVTRTHNGDSDIFLIDAETGAQQSQLTFGLGIDVAPNFSPDGQHIIFASERSGGSQIYMRPIAEGEASRLTFDGDFNSDPVFSPDGTQIVFVGRTQGRFDLFVMNLDGTGLQRITQDMGNNEDPTWSPDGRYLVFSSTRKGRDQLWLATADGYHQHPVTHGGRWTQPTWAP